jgi:hypothetical protein
MKDEGILAIIKIMFWAIVGYLVAERWGVDGVLVVIAVVLLLELLAHKSKK